MTIKKAKIFIAEDDSVVSLNLKITLSDGGFSDINIFRTGEELIKALKLGDSPDLLILDISLAGVLDGIEVAGVVFLEHKIPVIFLTSDRDRKTLEKVKKFRPQAYLLKPFDKDELISAIDLALYSFENDESENVIQKDALFNNSFLFIKTNRRLEKILFSDILYVEANDIYSNLHSVKGNYVLSYNLKTFEEKAPNDRFMRIHRSYLVNLDRIDSIDENNVIVNQQKVPIGKTYREELLKKLGIN